MSSGEKQIIINVYKSKIKEFPDITYKELIKNISQTTGVGLRTICTLISEYKRTGQVSSPNKKKCRPKVDEKFDDHQKNAIRQIMHSFCHNKQIPTLCKILDAVHQCEDLPMLSQSSLHRLLKELNFEYTKKGGWTDVRPTTARSSSD